MKFHFCLILFFISPFLLLAQWEQTSIGPNFNFVDILTFRDTLYATPTGSIVYSTNAGESFSIIPTVLGSSSYFNIYVGETGLYAMSRNRVARTRDLGVSWELLGEADFSPSDDFVDLFRVGNRLILVGINRKIYYNDIGTETFFPAQINQQIVPPLTYGGVGNSEMILVPSQAQLLKSTDSGLTWDPIPIESRGQFLDVLMLEDRIIAATSGGGVFVSNDNSATWEPLNNGLPENGRLIVSMRELSNGDVMLCAIIEGNEMGSNFYLLKAGETQWSLVFDEAGDEIVGNLLSIDEDILYATVFNGGIWKRNIGQIVSLRHTYLNPQITIAPNPVNTVLNWGVPEGFGPIEWLRVFDPSGKMLIQRPGSMIPTSNVKGSLRIHGLKPGAYVLQLSSNSHTVTKQFVKR